TAMNEVETAKVDGGGAPRLLVAGPGAGAVRERLLDSRFHMWIVCMDHDRGNYDENLPKMRAGDLVVLLIAGDEPARVPGEYAWLAPPQAAEVERALRDGKTVAAEHVPRGTYRVVLLAAPTRKALEALARASPLLAQ